MEWAKRCALDDTGPSVPLLGNDPDELFRVAEVPTVLPRCGFPAFVRCARAKRRYNVIIVSMTQLLRLQVYRLEFGSAWNPNNPRS